MEYLQTQTVIVISIGPSIIDSLYHDFWISACVIAFLLFLIQLFGEAGGHLATGIAILITCYDEHRRLIRSVF